MMALLLFIPGAGALVLTGLIPWLLKTHHRLDNTYWEFQLLFAILAIAAPALTIIPLAFRAFKNDPPASFKTIWATIILAHAITAAFLLQSDTNIFLRIFLSFIPLAAMTAAIFGWRADSQTLSSTVDSD